MSVAGKGARNTTDPDTSPAFFEAMYRRDRDPWSFGVSEYEQGRYDTIVHSLKGRRYGRAFEPGCSLGHLTERLSGLCDSVEALDVSATATEQAQERCAAKPNVKFSVGALPEALPGGHFDLIVLSEIGYYFNGTVWRTIIDQLMGALQPGATLLAAHWLGHSADHCMSGDAVHAVLRARTGLRLERGERHERPQPDAGFRLDRWVRV